MTAPEETAARPPQDVDTAPVDDADETARAELAGAFEMAESLMRELQMVGSMLESQEATGRDLEALKDEMNKELDVLRDDAWRYEEWTDLEAMKRELMLEALEMGIQMDEEIKEMQANLERARRERDESRHKLAALQADMMAFEAEMRAALEKHAEEAAAARRGGASGEVVQEQPEAPAAGGEEA
ncbi:unnamed protein product [Pedinophyceae sp. YPF-701]|nr:unnamed protein product [Pedinophyceae sp. YPF-701]